MKSLIKLYNSLSEPSQAVIGGLGWLALLGRILTYKKLWRKK
tara:strand:+ start:571 stop:696 length:126 start_codon:yes stop_codon:yes gene_type:complete